ncbi:MAG: DMT family transporter [Woeseiaceae bacterium]
MDELAVRDAAASERRYGFGVLLVVVGAVFLSTNGIMLRHIEQADSWQILFYRGIAFTITLFLILVFNYRRKTAQAFHAIGLRGMWAGLALGLASSCYIFALMLTTIANAMFIIGAAPLATAFGAWLVLHERTSRTGVITMIVALGGISLLFADGVGSGRWLGNVMALGVVAGFVVYLLTVRGSRNIDMLPAVCLSGLVMVVFGIVGADSLLIQTQDLIIILTMGSVQISVGFMCYTIAARYILAAEVALFALTESILAPIWVWIGIGETPSSLTLAGIAIVLMAVIVYGVVEILRVRRALGLSVAQTR